MAPKKLKTGGKQSDIRPFLCKENEVPGSSTPRAKPRDVSERQNQCKGRTCKLHPERPQIRKRTCDFLTTVPPQQGTSKNKKKTTSSRTLQIKDENGGDPPISHSHHFTVTFSPSDKAYTVDCNQLCTVLEAVQSFDKSKIPCSDENIIIQMGKEDRKVIVATHFPCSCVPNGESIIIISCKQEKVEVQQQYDKTVHPEDAYVVFYIDTDEGQKTPKRGRFRSKAVLQFKYLCVYGEKGITVGEALKRDGRFSDDLSNFELSDNEDPKVFTVLAQRVDNLHQKHFKLRRPQKKVSGKNPISISDVVNERGRSVQKAIEQPGSSGSSEEIYELLRQQFPELKKWMESRFPGDSYQEKLNVRKENFGKIQRSFNEVHRIKKLLQMGKSVCKVLVQNVCQGTGFVLFENFILTSAHLFKGCVEGKNLKDHINVFVLFNYDDPEPDTNYFYFTAEKAIVDFDVELDYAILELHPDGQRSNQRTRAENIKVPPGLLNRLGPVPKSGEACIIGHPAGDVKKIDPTCVIEPDEREQTVTEHLGQYSSMFVVQSVCNELKKQGIEGIMIGGDREEQVSTYHTFMYHGASGSPVFDAHGQVFGLHTAGYEDKLSKKYVIEYAQPLLAIFEKFVCNMKDSENELLLKKVRMAAAGNLYLNKSLEVEPMEVDQGHN